MTPPKHNPRIDRATFDRIAPAAAAALGTLGRVVGDSGLDKSLVELIKLRASQINGCAFCIQYHLNVARQIGVPSVKLDLVAAWREAGVFSAREHAALAWAEALTFMAGSVVSDAIYAELQEQFSESEITFLTVAVSAINAWNRIAGALRFAPQVAVEHSASGNSS
ncbi:carboxymuconolactone decarboxylase family protein [Acidiferrobacter thiooxydans]|uniref:Carboxymuconolactone decarboxylase family protein n=1 Tax=Acidiferrobacter thiooxydans TaxID=163359 RepID=A0A1C2FZS0_9GAMM|nr:carboxymuconolactone decarboxylase family protein [Acidiferrobacter thiooxydans]RCN59574.1 carboxymuconolactone decarboxylase family protein [Acidiferrobacter thiooxydans]